MKVPKNLVVRDTHKYGLGVFANKDIKKGEIIYVLHGERIPLKEVVSRINNQEENLDDIFQIGKRTYIDLEPLSRTFNHSCDPNGGIRENSELFALRDIKQGEEITYDYSLTIAPTDWQMKCKCGSPKCRKMLGDILSVPTQRRKEYRVAGNIQRYMRKILDEMKEHKYKIPEYEKRALQELKY